MRMRHGNGLSLPAVAGILLGGVWGIADSSPGVQVSTTKMAGGPSLQVSGDPALTQRRRQAAEAAARPVDTTAAQGRRQRSRWSRLHARAVLRHDSAGVMDSISDFFATSPELDYTQWNFPRNEPDWKMNPYLLSWYVYGNRLSDTAQRRLKKVMRWYHDTIGFGGTENHIINRAVLVLMVDQALGLRDDKTAIARGSFRRWVWLRGHRGYMEFNSPMYHVRSLIPIFLLHDFVKDAELKALAKKVLDVALAEVALETAGGVRGGPWHRAATTTRGMSDGTSDAAYILSAIFFGTCAPKANSPLLPNLLTTSYRLPPVVASIAADPERMKGYEVRHRIATVKPQLDAYFFVTDRYVLGCYQNRSPMWCNYYGSTNMANLQPWRLTFTDPAKHLGPYRAERVEDDGGNTCTALMQYRNVLIYKGDWLDYNSNIGAADTEKTEGITRCFFAVDSEKTSGVYIGITDLPLMNGGAVEVGRKADFGSFPAFKNAVRATSLTFSDTSLAKAVYIGTSKDTISFDRGKASVNGKPFSLGRYELCESPYVRSKWDSGIWELTSGTQRMRIDFTDKSVQAGEGLTGEYFTGVDFKTPFMKRNDYTLDYNWQYRQLDTSIPADGFCVRWTGTLLADASGAHSFRMKSDGAVSFWVNDSLVIGRATPGPDSLELSGTTVLAAGKHYRAKLEYRHYRGNPKIWVGLAAPNNPVETIGLRGELFSGEKVRPGPPSRRNANVLSSSPD